MRNVPVSDEHATCAADHTLILATRPTLDTVIFVPNK